MRDEYLEWDDRGELVFTHNYLEVKKASLSEVVQESNVSRINVVLNQVWVDGVKHVGWDYDLDRQPVN